MSSPWPSADAEKAAAAARVRAGQSPSEASTDVACGQAPADRSVAQFAVEWDLATGQPDGLYFFASAGRPHGVCVKLEPGEGLMLGVVLSRREGVLS
jgi:hypothetical protein